MAKTPKNERRTKAKAESPKAATKTAAAPAPAPDTATRAAATDVTDFSRTTDTMATGVPRDRQAGNPAADEADRRFSENRADERAAREERRAARAENRENRSRGVTQNAGAETPAGTVGDPNNPFRAKRTSPYKPLGGVKDAPDGTMINRPFGSEPLNRPKPAAPPVAEEVDGEAA